MYYLYLSIAKEETPLSLSDLCFYHIFLLYSLIGYNIQSQGIEFQKYIFTGFILVEVRPVSFGKEDMSQGSCIFTLRRQSLIPI